MASKYEYDVNPMQDALLALLLNDVNITKKSMKKDITTLFVYVLENFLENPKDVINLEFQITKNKDWYNVKGMNSISALWLSGMFIDDIELIMKNDVFVFENKKYRYNKKNNELTLVKNEK